MRQTHQCKGPTSAASSRSPTSARHAGDDDDKDRQVRPDG